MVLWQTNKASTYKKLNISKRNYTARKADLARYCLGMGMARYEGSEILQKSSVYLSLQKTTNSKSIVCLAWLHGGVEFWQW